MESDARYRDAAGNLCEFGGSGNGGGRKIGIVDFCDAVGSQGKHSAVGGGAEVGSGGVGGGSGELIRCAGIPERERSTGSGTEGKKNVIASGAALHQGRAGQAGDFGLRS